MLMNVCLDTSKMERRLRGRGERVNGLLVSRPLRRLRKVSFLGAIDYVLAPDPLSLNRTRYHHSLAVACLVDQVVAERAYDRDTRDHLLAAALLHDIGHMPLSHSAEGAMRAHLSVDHHEAGLRVLSGDWYDARLFGRWLANHFDRERLAALISGDPAGGEGVDLFSHPVNVDTIDGIFRSAALAGLTPAVSAREVTAAAFLRSDDGRLSVLDAFWALKDRVYRELIHSPLGVMADNMAERRVSSAAGDMKESAVRATDVGWHKHWPALFDALHRREMVVPGSDVEYVARQYLTNNSTDVLVRYTVEKQKKRYSAEWLQAWVDGDPPEKTQGRGLTGHDMAGMAAH